MELYSQTTDADWIRQRLIGVMVFISIAFGVLIVRMYYLQIVDGKQYFRLSENNCVRRQPVNPARGLILDRNGVVLVDNRPAFDVMALPRNVRPLKETIARLETILQIPGDALRSMIDKKGRLAYQPVALRRDIDRDLLAAIEVRQYDLPGVYIDVGLRRDYIHRESAAHILGYLGQIDGEELKSDRHRENRPGDFIGKYGIERRYEATLRGRRGERLVEVDAKGQVVNVLQTIHAEPGEAVRLTIDIALQKKAEEMLAGKVGSVVVLDPDTGEILAMASAPSFDPNLFVGGIAQAEWQMLTSNPFRPLENKAIQGAYPPASTYKVVTAMAGLEEKIIDDRTTAFCPGSFRFGERDFGCWKKNGHGHMNVVRALAESCDVFFYHAGLKIGVDRLAWYAKGCGLGSPTGVLLDSEARGIIPTAAWKQNALGDAWYRGETLSVAIGQGYNQTTPIQLAVLMAAIANGGRRLQPTVIKSIAGKPAPPGRLLGKLPVHPETLDLIRQGLWEVVNSPGGTAYRLRIENMDVCGKTGTAQVVSRTAALNGSSDEKRRSHKSHGWFMAYAPRVHPKIALAVIIEHGESGSGAAGPVAMELIRAYLTPADEVGPGSGS